MTARQPDPSPAADGAPDHPPEIARLADALAAEHAAVYAYGPVGVRLDDDLAGPAREAEEAHRDRRDTLVRALAERGAPVPAAEPSYALPFEVASAEEALRLAVLVEERVAAVWRAVLPDATGMTRVTALDALVDAAVRATAWRAAADEAPVTVPFPGAP